jgi:hypothetical protein
MPLQKSQALHDLVDGEKAPRKQVQQGTLLLLRRASRGSYGAPRALGGSQVWALEEGEESHVPKVCEATAST